MPVISNQQRKFCEEYVKNGNVATKAYLIAYKSCKTEKTAGVNASRLLGNARIQEYIKELQDELKKKAIMSAEERMIWLSKVVNGDIKHTSYDGNGNSYENEAYISDKMKAIDIMNKMDGEYINKVELSNNQEKPFEVKITVVK